VTDDVAGADLVFSHCAGGISSVSFDAPSGAITNLRRFEERFRDLKHAEALARSVVRAEPGAAGGTTASGGDRMPTSDAFLMRTRGGAWVTFAIAERSDHGPWTEQPVRIRYVLNDVAPVFRDGKGDVTVGGIEVDSQAVARLDRELSEAAERAHAARV